MKNFNKIISRQAVKVPMTYFKTLRIVSDMHYIQYHPTNTIGCLYATDKNLTE